MGANINKLRTPTIERRTPAGSKLRRRGARTAALLGVAAAAVGCGTSAKPTSAVMVNKASTAPASPQPGRSTTPKTEKPTAGAYDLSRAPVMANLCGVPGITQKLVALFRGRLPGATDITVSGCTAPTPAVEATGWTVGYVSKFGVRSTDSFQISDGTNQTQLLGPANIPALRGATVTLTLSAGNVDVLVGAAQGDTNSKYYATTEGVAGTNPDGSTLSFEGQEPEIAALGNQTVEFLVGSGVMAAYFPPGS
jgi:hypothetical protein